MLEFYYYEVGELLWIFCEGVVLILIVGIVYGEVLLVKVFVLMFFIEVMLEVGVMLDWFVEYYECGVYVIDGEV